ncbi:MAG: hypothetical protein ACYDEJ_10055 [Desulfitobacteriaceae bacterium]
MLAKVFVALNQKVIPFDWIKKVKRSELVQLKLNIDISVESTPTEAEYGVPLPLVEVVVSRWIKEDYDDSVNQCIQDLS